MGRLCGAAQVLIYWDRESALKAEAPGIVPGASCYSWTMALLTKEMADQYLADWKAAQARPRHLAEIVSTARQLEANRHRYAAIAREFSMPWMVVAVVDAMESSGGCDAHLHNGDPLTARTQNHPPGRPIKGSPPFTWEESARDALEYDHARSVKTWDIPHTLFWLEGFNGYGYRSKYVQDRVPGIRSPYLFSYTTLYTRGKFVSDGLRGFRATSVSRQCGAVPLLKALGYAPEPGSSPGS